MNPKRLTTAVFLLLCAGGIKGVTAETDFVKIKKIFRGASETKIDITNFLNARTDQESRDCLLQIYSDCIGSEDTFAAKMAISVMIYEEEDLLAPVVSKRLENLGDSIDDLRLRALSLRALAASTGENISERLIPLINHHNGKIRYTAMNAARDAETNAELINLIKIRLKIEDDDGIKVAALGALSQLDFKNSDFYISRLKSMVESEKKNIKVLATAELTGLGIKVDRPDSEKENDCQSMVEKFCMGNYTEQELITLVMSDNHAVRLEAVKRIAESDSEKLHFWMKKTAFVPVMHARLMGAYYTYLRQDHEEALERLQQEDSKAVQIMLLGTFFKNGGEKGNE